MVVEMARRWIDSCGGALAAYLNLTATPILKASGVRKEANSIGWLTIAIGQVLFSPQSPDRGARGDG
jgi:hypothetical protein